MTAKERVEGDFWQLGLRQLHTHKPKLIPLFQKTMGLAPTQQRDRSSGNDLEFNWVSGLLPLSSKQGLSSEGPILCTRKKARMGGC